MTPAELLERYVLLHNYGVETGDFEPLMGLFGADAVFEFEDPRIGRFEGLETIRGVFRRQAPSTAIVIFDVASTGAMARAEYADENLPDERLGFISAEIESDKIKRLFIGR